MASEQFRNKDTTESQIGDLIREVYPYIPRPNCPDGDTRFAYAFRELTGPALERVKQHISECGFCAFEDGIAKHELPYEIANQKRSKEFYENLSTKIMVDMIEFPTTKPKKE